MFTPVVLYPHQKYAAEEYARMTIPYPELEFDMETKMRWSNETITSH